MPGTSTRLTIGGGADDSGVMGGIERTGHYEPHVMMALQRVLRSDGVCIDGGANIGVLSLAMASYAPSGRVFAFEPGAENYQHLVDNLETNGATNVVPIRLGLWDRTTTLQLNVEAGHAGGAFVGTVDDPYSEAESISVVAIDDWVRERGLDRVDLIKLDIEGAEPWALAGAEETIRALRPTLIMEFNPTALLRQQSDYWELFDRLRSWFGRISIIRADGSTLLIDSNRLAHKLLLRAGSIDLLCEPDPPERGVDGVRDRLRSMREHVKLTSRYNRWRPSPQAFAYAPSYRARFLVNEVRLRSLSATTVPLRILNTGEIWFDSDYPDHPITAAYHWATRSGQVIERDSPRTLFAEPLGPGRVVVLPLHVEAPATPGEYLLVFSLVQERFAWFDDLRPELAVQLLVRVID